MQFKIINGGVSFGADTVLERIDFEIRDKEKIAVVGRNGCGKTTLLKTITGEVPLEAGTGEETFSLAVSGAPVIGYLKQIDFEDESLTMEEEISKVFAPIFETEARMAELEKKLLTESSEKTVKSYSAACERYEHLGGYTYKKELAVMIKKFGFTEADRKKRLNEFSGGQRTRIAFIKLLLSKPDILLLDEPTNHLDAETVEWLEGYLKNYPSAVVIVSHDRMFLDKTVNKVYEIEYGETKCYKGNYSDFERLKREEHVKRQKDHDLQRAEIARLTRLIERFRYKATKAKMVQSKIKMIERMKIIDAPDRYDLKTFHARFKPAFTGGTEALIVSELQIGYGKPLAEVSFNLYRGDKLGIIGANGTGKSTLLKTLTGEVKPLSGSFAFGSNTLTGYFDQQLAGKAGTGTVLEDFMREFPACGDFEARSALGAFLFSGEDVFKNTADLSGGERVRLALCKIFRKRPNFLILDEPTNHMDIVGRETLENMLSLYEGTALFVSHDRYFVKKTANKLLVFSEGKAKFYPFGYAEYEEMRAREAGELEKSLSNPGAAGGKNEPKDGGEDTGGKKKEFTTPLKQLGKDLARIKKLERLLSENEKRAQELSESLLCPAVYSDYKAAEQVQSELEELKAQAEEYYEEWLALSEKTETGGKQA